MIDLEKTFEKYEDQYLETKNVTLDYSRPDMCAFMLLDRLLGAKDTDMICGAAHDEIFLDVDCERLAEVATEEDILTLIHCGVRYEDGYLCMFA